MPPAAELNAAPKRASLRSSARSATQIADNAGEVALPCDLELADGKVDGERRADLALCRHLTSNTDYLLDAGALITVQVSVMLGSMQFRHQGLDAVVAALTPSIVPRPSIVMMAVAAELRIASSLARRAEEVVVGSGACTIFRFRRWPTDFLSKGNTLLLHRSRT